MSDSRERGRATRAQSPRRTRHARAKMLRAVEPDARAAVAVAGGELGIGALVEVARRGAPVVLDPGVAASVDSAHRDLAARVRAGRRVYGWNTGVGALDARRVAARNNREHQKKLLRSHAAGVGPPMPDEQVRAMMLARANMLVGARSGVRLPTLRALLALLDRGVTPLVPELGSVGASDLAPLAHVGLVLVGEGRARVGDEDWMPAREALSRAGLRPVALGGRDALALMNGLAQTAGIGALAVHDAERLVNAAELAAALTMVALEAGAGIDPALDAARDHAGVHDSAARLRALLQGRVDSPRRFREPVSVRCAHQVAGAARETLARARRVMESELAAAADNPLPDSGGEPNANASTFHGQVAAEALGALSTSVGSLAAIAEQRVCSLLDGTRSGLPAFLAASHGPGSGMMIAQYTAAALVAELRSRSVPASLLSSPTCSGTEDHVSMSALAARHAWWSVQTVEAVVAIELLGACRAARLARRPLPGRLAPAYEAVLTAAGEHSETRALGDEIDAVLRLLRRGDLDV